MSKILFMLLFCFVPMPSVSTVRFRTNPTFSPSCPFPWLAHGRARLRQRAHMVRFVCDPYYELVGHRYSTCRENGWDEPTPICVRHSPTCVEPSIDNGVMIPSHHDAWLMFFCMPQYKLNGTPVLYCDGATWNGTAPTCVRETAEAQLSCNFEQEDLCGWWQDDTHDFDWKRHNLKTPSSFAFTGPSFDHTFGNSSAGYYMYIESSSKRNNDTARLISPMYSANLTQDGCFSFFYHMYGKYIGGLRVYQVPENSRQIVHLSEAEKQENLLFEKWGNLGDTWFRNVSSLRNTNSDFQIVIEGIRGASFTSDIAIDDVAILQGSQCVDASNTAVTPPELRSETCSGRCDVTGPPTTGLGCGCSLSCTGEDTCCPDFIELCIFGVSTSTDDDDDYSTLPPSTIPTTTTNTTTTTPRAPTRPPPAPRNVTAAPVIKPTPRTIPPPTTIPTTIPTTTTTTTIKPTAKPITTTKSLTTTKLTTKAPVRTTPRKSTDTERQHNIEDQKVVQKESESSGSTAAVVSLLLLAVCLAAVALYAGRSARGRAALARLRARRAGDTEVRFLTRDQD